MDKKYYALAYYLFTPIEAPHEEVKKHKIFFEGRDVSGRIYLSEEGINGQMSGSIEDAEAYMAWFKQDPRFANTHFKIHEIEANIFPRMTVKYRKQLVALDEKADTTQGGDHVSPKKWKEMIESGEYMLIDVRNNYEWKIGHFEGSVCPPLETFREFPEYAEKLAKEVDPKKTKIMMCCTGGIRCELYSVVMKERGFDEVYQLDGGIINYGQEVGHDHWKGKLFVFDDRLAISIDGEAAEPIAKCQHCDTYYNCANMDCNELFISCPDCLEKTQGCCSDGCQEAPRVREFDASRSNKPFRRKHLSSSCCCAVPAQDSKCATGSAPSQP